jgi:hypothetical protein
MHNESDPEGIVARVLAALPAEDARPYDWSEFQRRRVRALPGRRARAVGALAAAAVCALAAVAVWVRLEPHTATPAASAPASARGATGSAAEEPRAAEAWLARLPREPAIVQVGTRADVLGLEDRIAQVDDLLTAGGAGRGPPVSVLALQRERARLVSSLVQVRYAETLANESR